MDVDEGDYAPAKATSSRKRKRTVSTSSRKTAPRGAVRPTRSTTGTPLNKAVKKRSVSSSVLLEQNPDATRVFALWKQDNHYYTGIVHSMASDNPPRYLIKFDDNTEDRVDATKLRMCLLKAGDHVMMGTNMRAIVVEDTMSGATDVCVRFNNSDDDDAMVVPLNNVRIASRTLLSRFKDRVLDPKDIIPAIGPAPFKPSPSPNRLSLASDGSAKGNRKLFSKTGLVVTLGPGNDDWERVKDRLMLSIRNHGGAVVEDWCDIFTLDGTFSQGNKRWIGEKDDIRWIERDDIDRVFLLSDDANQKPKFLIALALGIPCLSTEWLEVSINERTERDWQAYLLPAGFCDPLNARVSQLVDLDWGNSVEHLTEIMSNLVPSKLFADQSILCLSPEFMPAPPKASRKVSTDIVRESGGMVPKIILCMGASRVEAVADARHATHPDLNKYDYVIVKEQSEVYRVSSTKGANCVHFGWVKDCLIAGRLLPRSSC
ncbi:hypothetical protein OBBRIDRAFT_727222 [Obba rivulosa]|uniref:BRCT domain-containing protein n=1 Tax=Obba rivulosa TaxID=1052685 RepID=A0A8E2DL66_9APHY|nr:hypothetical protein OBBRIDRAFT_727222 [Obba rivulosa]